MEPIGLYIHVPFCLSKCPYCDFYSYAASDEAMDAYTAAVERALADWAARIGVPADTLYIGGGTPSLLGGARPPGGGRSPGLRLAGRGDHLGGQPR